LRHRLDELDESEAKNIGDMMHDISDLINSETDKTIRRDLDKINKLLQEHKADLDKNQDARQELIDNLVNCASDILAKSLGMDISHIQLLTLPFQTMKNLTQHQKDELLVLQDIARHVEELEFNACDKSDAPCQWFRDFVLATARELVSKPEISEAQYLAAN